MMRKVLIVEDSRTQLERLKALVETEGHEVQAAGDGQEGLAKATTWLPDLVITDVVMPRMDGYELCLRLRDNSTTREIPIIMLTSKGEPADIVKGLEVGADNFITKPYEDVLLLGRLRSFFAEQGGRRTRKFRLTMELELFGKKITVTPEKQQIVELLLGTMEELATANHELRARATELSDAYGRLTEVTKQKTRFLNNVSHELRQPLNAIIGFGDLLATGASGDLTTQQADYLRDIRAASQHLLSLTNDLLDLAKLEAGAMQLKRTEFDLNGALVEAVALVRPQASAKSIELAVRVDSHIGALWAGEREVKQIVINLLSNAIKFTPTGGVAGVAARREHDEVHITVWDTGIGIAPEDQARVFEEFTQVEGDGASGAGKGTGLGLTLALRLAKLHGGRIHLESAMGKGSRFTLIIPQRSTSDTPVPEQPAQP